MHLRGKSFEYRVVYPDGKTDTLLSVPRYDFGWQTIYWLEKPLALPADTRIECTAHFDNSTANLNNPDPETFMYQVEVPPRHELEEAGMAELAMREAAGLSGGAFYREEDLVRLAESVPEQKVRFYRHQEIILWNPLVMVLFVLLVSAEWLIRKFSDLV